MARGEKTHQFRGSRIKSGSATTWGAKGINKERDLKEVRSDAHVLSNGPAQVRPMRGVL